MDRRVGAEPAGTRTTTNPKILRVVEVAFARSGWRPKSGAAAALRAAAADGSISIRFGRTAGADSALLFLFFLAAALLVAFVLALAALIALLVLSTRLILATLARSGLPRLALTLISTLRRILRHRDGSFHLPLCGGDL